MNMTDYPVGRRRRQVPGSRWGHRQEPTAIPGHHPAGLMWALPIAAPRVGLPWPKDPGGQ